MNGSSVDHPSTGVALRFSLVQRQLGSHRLQRTSGDSLHVSSACTLIPSFVCLKKQALATSIPLMDDGCDPFHQYARCQKHMKGSSTRSRSVLTQPGLLNTISRWQPPLGQLKKWFFPKSELQTDLICCFCRNLCINQQLKVHVTMCNLPVFDQSRFCADLGSPAIASTHPRGTSETQIRFAGSSWRVWSPKEEMLACSSKSVALRNMQGSSTSNRLRNMLLKTIRV